MNSILCSQLNPRVQAPPEVAPARLPLCDPHSTTGAKVRTCAEQVLRSQNRIQLEGRCAQLRVPLFYAFAGLALVNVPLKPVTHH